ncbi:MAG: alkane 1-monooxygenase, partial [Betaproteobacteria bacterium]|nr:alkane 1-monooxygenase [Betaproteobacteria bacterium]
MQAALATQPNTPYRDRKRHAWLLSLLVPSTVLVGPAAMVWSGDAWALWAPVLFFYGVVPAIDYFMGEDLSNPPEEAVPALEADRYYRWITYLLAPVLWAAFIFSAWFAASHDLPL